MIYINSIYCHVILLNNNCKSNWHQCVIAKILLQELKKLHSRTSFQSVPVAFVIIKISFIFRDFPNQFFHDFSAWKILICSWDRLFHWISDDIGLLAWNKMVRYLYWNQNDPIQTLNWSLKVEKSKIL